MPSRHGTALKLHDVRLQVFNQLQGNSWSSLAKLRSCIGDTSADTRNPILEAEMKRQRGNNDVGEVSHSS